MSVYSRRFLIATGLGAIYVVPANMVAVVKCISAFNTGGAASFASLFINGYPVHYLPCPAGQGTDRSGLAIVFHAGDEMKCNASTGVTAQVSGYLLSASL